MKWLEKAATLELKSNRQNKSIGRNKCDHVAGFWAPEGCSLGIETHTPPLSHNIKITASFSRNKHKLG